MSAGSRYEAQRIFDAEVVPVSWAWRNGPLPLAPNPVFVPWTKSSADYWRDKLAKDNARRNTIRQHQDDLETTEWVAVRCGYG